MGASQHLIDPSVQDHLLYRACRPTAPDDVLARKSFLISDSIRLKMRFPYPFLIVSVTSLPLSSVYPRVSNPLSTNISLPMQSASLSAGLPTSSRTCGTSSPTKYLRSTHARLRKRSLAKRASPATSKFTVDTFFHIVSTSDSSMMVTKDMIANQLGTLQAAYAPSNISFNLLGTDHTVNDSWASNQDDCSMKLALRKGNYSTLNIYFQTNLTTLAGGIPTQLLGYCTLPTNVTYSPCSDCPLAEESASTYFQDGCNVLAGSMPNGHVVGYNQGKTTVHEVGHWFGLLHTFQDTTCASDDPGDYIDDTPQESVSTDGCPSGKKSCPECLGLDPVHNFMDYSTDAW